jgi:hypothetical protein
MVQLQTIEPTLEQRSPPSSAVAETVARRAANRYLSGMVGIPFGAVMGVYIPIGAPIWQFAIEFHLPRLGRLAIMGTIDVDAQTGEPIPLTSTEIQKIQDRANVIVQFCSQTTAERITSG